MSHTAWFTTLALLLVIAPTHGHAQTYQTRFSAGHAYDATRSRLVVFGGFYRGEYPAGTWEWDGTDWQQVSSKGPQARNSPAMAWDARRQVVVMFGGDAPDGPLGDTWEWDGLTWRLAESAGPPARTLHRMVFDPRSGQTLLFGGLAGQTLLADTWSWDGSTWRRLAEDGPPARALHALASVPGTGEVLLFGGMADLGPDAPKHRDTWLWDGEGWTRFHGPGPSARDHVQATADPRNGRIVVHGGSGLEGQRWLGDTWTWNRNGWQRLTTGPALAGHNLYFDVGRQAVAMFGGFGPDGGTAPTAFWLLDDRSWAEADPTTGR